MTSTANDQAHHPKMSSSILGSWFVISAEMVLFGCLIASAIAFRILNPNSFLESSRALNGAFGFLSTLLVLSAAFIIGLHAVEKIKSTKSLYISSAIGAVFILLKIIECLSLRNVKALQADSAQIFMAHLHLLSTVFVLHLLLAIGFNLYIAAKKKKEDEKRCFINDLKTASLLWQGGAVAWVIFYPLIYCI